MPKDQNFVKEEYAPIVQRRAENPIDPKWTEKMSAAEFEDHKRVILRLEIFIGFMFFVIGAAHRAAGPMAFLATPIIFVAGILRSILQQVLPVWQKIDRSISGLWIWNFLIGIFSITLGFFATGVVLMLAFHTPLLHN